MMPQPQLGEVDLERQMVWVYCGDAGEWMTKDELTEICGAWDSIACTAFHRLAGTEHDCT